MNEQPILIAGLGSAGRRHFRNLQTLGYANFVFYRSHRSTLPEEELGNWPSFTDLNEALSCQPRMAIVANPTSLHLEVAATTAQSGCHLFIEKPLSNTLAGCQELQALAEQNQIVTMVGCQYRFHPLLMTLREQLQAGRIGEILGVRAEWGEYLPNWHPWEDYRQSYSARQSLGGGTVLTLIHPLDYLYWLFGPVLNVHASIGSISSLQTDTDDDFAEITLQFVAGMIGQVHLDYIQRPPRHTLTIWGEEAQVRLDFLAGELHWTYPDGKSRIEKLPTGFDRNRMFMDEMRHFLTCVRESQPTRIPLAEGVAVLDIALQAKRDALRRQQTCPA